MNLLFDVHLDLSLNALEWNRDLRLHVDKIRGIERELPPQMKGQGLGTVAFPEMRKGGVGLCVGTQIAGCMKPRAVVACWESPQQAWAMTQGQLAWYRAMEESGEITLIKDLAGLDAHLKKWEDPEKAAEHFEPIGVILSLEGADSMVTIDNLERAWDYGLRALGPAHYGEGRYAMGHDSLGHLKPEGPELLRKMNELGMILDVTHLNDDCFWQALEIFEGTVWASHSNCRAVVDDVRQFSDEQLKALIERGAVIGAVFDTWMMIPGWVRGESVPQQIGVKIEHIADHIDHICQLAGNARHCGIGSDLDGGFGKEQCPMDLDTIADLQKLEGILDQRGYTADEITGIFNGNFLRVLRDAWS